MSDIVPRLALLAGLIAAALTARAEDPEYISAEELANEVQRRQEDIARTTARIASLAETETDATAELERARADSQKVEALVTARARLLYRLHRNGGTLRYLLGASSPMEVLKRLGELGYLLRTGLEARKLSGSRLAAAESALSTVQSEKKAAEEMLATLQGALEELLDEQARREAGPPHMASR